jgi:hypothetical protein
MHAGDPLPPLIFRFSDYDGSYASHFTGEPSRSTVATSSSAPGVYPIVITPGTLKPVIPSDQVRFVNGLLMVLPADVVGAHLANNIGYPAGFFNGPSGFSVLDVTHNQIATLVGDCATDNSKAFASLLTLDGARTSNTKNGGRTPLYLYFPPGCYATSEPLTIYGNTWTLWGAGPDTSVIRLLPQSPEFNTGHATQFFSPQSVAGNQNFREYVYNLGFNIGRGNPDAIPFTTDQNNVGAVRNVQIWADDSRCPYAINLRRAYPGPMLFKDVAVYGCAMAYSANQSEYSITFENLTTEAQSQTALDNGSLKASIRHWLSVNAVPALHAYGSGGANVAALDSQILQGGRDVTGIMVDPGSSVYLRNLTATGYGITENDRGTGTAVMRTGNIAQAWAGAAQTLFNRRESPDSLHLPVEETPTPDDVPPNRWTQLSADVSDWPREILQSQSTTVYAPPGVYRATGTTEISVPDTVTHLQFYQATFETSTPQIVLTIAGSSRHPLIIDGCPYGSCQILHSGRRTVVVRDSTLHSYISQNGAGDLYAEDSILGGGAVTVRFYPSQRIWARQLNLEESADKLDCSGCKLWVLGYKTELPSPSIVITDRAEAEIFGFFFYQNRPPRDETTANICITDSSLFATGWTKVDLAGYGEKLWIKETQGSSTALLPTTNVNTSQQMNAFYSFGADTRRGHTGQKQNKPQ